jgi:hypothetical protein
LSSFRFSSFSTIRPVDGKYASIRKHKRTELLVSYRQY